MARTRQIKPDFFKDEDLAELSAHARLLFIGLWTQADRNGRLEERPLKLKAEIFPYESVLIDNLLDELSRDKRHGSGTLILRYESGGRKYIQISNFERHQNPHPKEPESELPAPGRVIKRQAAKLHGEQHASNACSLTSSIASSSPSSSAGVPASGRKRQRHIQEFAAEARQGCEDFAEILERPVDYGEAKAGKFSRLLREGHTREEWRKVLMAYRDGTGEQARFAKSGNGTRPSGPGIDWALRPGDGGFAKILLELEDLEHSPPTNALAFPARASPLSAKDQKQRAAMVATVVGGLKGDGTGGGQ